jgi:predicted N-acetyltransferase YhbS
MDEPYSCRKFRNGDEEQVKKLVESIFSRFMGGEYWNWKYPLNPLFNPSLVVVAEKDGRIVGCNHWLQRRFKIDSTSEVEAGLGADVAVASDFRNMGVGKALLKFVRTANPSKRYAVMYMFADPELRKRFHSPVAGYVPAPDRTVAYTKIMNWMKVRQNVSSFNQKISRGHGQRALEGDLSVLFRVASAPPLVLNIRKEGVEVHEKEAALKQHTDVAIIGDVATLSSLKGKGSSTRQMLNALLTGRLKIRGKPWKFWSLYKNLWVFKEVLSGKIT